MFGRISFALTEILDGFTVSLRPDQYQSHQAPLSRANWTSLVVPDGDTQSLLSEKDTPVSPEIPTSPTSTGLNALVSLSDAWILQCRSMFPWIAFVEKMVYLASYPFMALWRTTLDCPCGHVAALDLNVLRKRNLNPVHLTNLWSKRWWRQATCALQGIQGLTTIAHCTEHRWNPSNLPKRVKGCLLILHHTRTEIQWFQYSLTLYLMEGSHAENRSVWLNLTQMSGAGENVVRSPSWGGTSVFFVAERG